MLQSESQTEQASAAGQARITPEELSRAVTAIEGRQEAEARRLAGTIVIDEAVSQLHLDVTPEAIWAEVQAHRETDAATQAQPERSAGTRSGPPQARPVTAPRGRRRVWPRLVIPAVALWVLYSTGLIPHVGRHTPPGPPALAATAAQIPDGTQFYCDSAGLVQISEGRPLPQVHVEASQGFGNSWTLVKMAGHVYLRAYTLPLSSVQAVRGQPLVLYNDDDSGALWHRETAQTTVRVDGIPLAISGGDDEYTQITMPQFQPDHFTTTSEWR